MPVLNPIQYQMTRRWLFGAMSSLAFSLQSIDAEAQSAGVNDIIKSLAPIAGQTITGGYKPIRREPVIVESETIYVDMGRHVELEVFFEYDSAKITPNAERQLATLGIALASPKLSEFRYLIAGHTDAVGSDAYNLDLSRRRAASVRQYLSEAFPIDPHRLMAVGFGFHRLKRPEAPRAAINRRVEVLLIVP